MLTDYSYQNIEAHFSAIDKQLVDTTIDDDYALIAMNDPSHLNCLSGALTIQLRQALESVSREPAVRAIILTGTDPAFSAGGDVELMAVAHESLGQQSPEGATVMRSWIRNQFGGIARCIKQSEKLMIAAVNGPAAGVGLAFALASDLIVASENARIVPAFGKIGLAPEVGTSWFLTRCLGYQKAMEFYLKGQELTGQEAYDFGMVNELVSHDELLPAAKAYVERARQLPHHLVGMTKTLLNRAADSSWEQALELEEFIEPLCFTTQFHQQAVQKFIKR